MERILYVLFAVGAMSFAPLAEAQFYNAFIGSQCSFADNPLAGHNKIHHMFTNTSGSSQWVTCPIARRAGWNIEYASIETNQPVSIVRLEMRNDNAGTLVGWDAEGASAIGNARDYYWFSGAATGTGGSAAVLAFEMFLPNNMGIYKYELTEKTGP